MKIVKWFFSTKVHLWILVFLVLAMIVLYSIGKSKGIAFSQTINSKETQVVKAMKKQKEVAILALSVTDIYSQTEFSDIAGFKIPFTEKTSYVQGSFDAKLGFDGDRVEIAKDAGKSNTYNVIIPGFTVIGISNPEFKEITTSGEILSFGTDIDTNEMQNKALSDETLIKYIEPNKDWLKDQTEDYYTSIVESIDADAKLVFNFEDS